MLPSTLVAKLGALCYIAWGLFHVKVAHDIYTLGSAQTGMARGRLYQLAASAARVRAVAPWANTSRRLCTGSLADDCGAPPRGMRSA